MTETIKIVCIFDACGANKAQCIIPMGEVFSVYRDTWNYEGRDWVAITRNNKDYGFYAKIFFKTLAEYRDWQIDEILKD